MTFNKVNGRMEIMRPKTCERCGVNPVLEKWNSGGSKYAVRCNNPDRGDDCDLNFIILYPTTKKKQ